MSVVGGFIQNLDDAVGALAAETGYGRWHYLGLCAQGLENVWPGNSERIRAGLLRASTENGLIDELGLTRVTAIIDDGIATAHRARLFADTGQRP